MIRNKMFLYGVVATLSLMAGAALLDSLVFGGYYFMNRGRINNLEGDLEKVTQEAMECAKNNAVLQSEVALLKPLADKLVDQQQALEQTQMAYTEAQKNILRLNQEIQKLKDQFCEKLADLQKKYPDMIAYEEGRYRFQPALLFDNASAKIHEKGEKILNEMAEFLKDFIQEAPQEFQWFIRIDGHTNHLPINNQTYKSNWELANARAMEVLTHLTGAGIDGKYLVAASFGPHHPISGLTGEQALRKNRRIEFSISLY